jgi:RNA polymerase sigma factor (sigma-70 family)
MATAHLGGVLRHVRDLGAEHTGQRLSDRALLQLFLTQGDPRAFEAIVARHGPMVLRVCRRVLGQAQDAEDAFQATFLVLVRQSASIRKCDSLASWLHGVAYRMATNARRSAARRRRHEQARAAGPQCPAPHPALVEVQAALDEEVLALPASYREPFVLCCLEQHSCAEAAGLLGLKEATVRKRLDRARDRLRQQLTRRGVSLTAALTALALSADGARAAVRPSLAGSTVGAATHLAAGQPLAAGLVHATVVSLVEGAKHHMAPTKLQTLVLVLLALGVVGAGLGLAAFPAAPPAPPRGIQPPAQRAAQDQEKPGPAVVVKGDTVTVTGRVLGPDGKPFRGAQLYAWWQYSGQGKAEVKVRANSGADGRFRFSFTKGEVDQPAHHAERWRFVEVVASAKGFGPTWQRINLIDGQLTLRLVRDDIPIQGRILDLEGRPVAGVAVRVTRVDTTAGEDLAEKVNAGKDFANYWRVLHHAPWSGTRATATTGKDGRFRVAGIGRGRAAWLRIAGPTIEHQTVRVVTREKLANRAAHPATFEIIVGPTKSIEGVIRARDTRKPLAGVTVRGGSARAVTDARGRYRLVGLRKSARYELAADPPTRQPYLSAVKVVEDTEGLKPVAADFDLRRGVPVRLRLIDRKTKKLVVGTVNTTPLDSNPHYREAEFAPGVSPTRELNLFRPPDKDGVYHLTVYPGPALLVANVSPYDGTRYRPARLSPADLKRLEKLKDNVSPIRWLVEHSHGYHLFDTGRTDRVVPLDILLEPAAP